MGVVLARMGRFEESKRAFLQALACQEKTFGPLQQDVGTTLNRLGSVETELGDLETARATYQRALETFVKVYSPAHPLAADSLVGLGRLQLESGDVDGAEKSLRRALAIQEDALGTDHPKVAETLVDLARMSWARKDAQGALLSALRGEDILRRQFDQVVRSLSESEALSYEKIRATGIDLAVSVLASGSAGDRSPGSVEKVWSELVRSRALVLDQIASRHRILSSYRSPELKGLLRESAAAANRLAALVVRGPNPDHPEDYRKSLAEAAAEKEKLERELAQKTGDTQEKDAERPLALAELRSALPEGAALLAYVKYRRTDAGASGAALPSH